MILGLMLGPFLRIEYKEYSFIYWNFYFMKVSDLVVWSKSGICVTQFRLSEYADGFDEIFVILIDVQTFYHLQNFGVLRVVYKVLDLKH